MLIAPIYNADGNEQVSKDNRPGQIGPEEGMGQRANRMGLDLNRDYMKLEAPETQALVRLLRRWDPQVVIDTHTTNGSHHRYVLTFDGPRHPATDPELVNFVRQDLLPAVKRLVAESSDYDTFFYGDFDADHKRWTTYPAAAALRGPLCRTPQSYFYFKRGLRLRTVQGASAGDAGVRIAVFERHPQRRERIAKLLADVDRRARQGRGEVALRGHIVSHDEKITVKGFVEEEKDGKQVATDEPRDYEVEDVAKSVADLSVPLPSAYLLSTDFGACRENLQRHGIRVEQLREDIELEVEASRIGKVSHAERAFEGHRLAALEVEREPRRRQFPAGTLVVRTAQPLGRLAALLLEPESDDGFVAWNFFDEHLKDGGEFPVYRLPADQTLLTAPVRPLAEDRSTGRRVTFETLYGETDERVDFDPPSTSITWLPDGKHYLQIRQRRLCKVDALTGRSSPYPEREKLAESLAAIPSMEPSRRRSISRQTSFNWNEDKSAALIVHGDDLYHLPMDGSPALRLTRSRGEEQYAKYSPDGRYVAYVRGRNLYITDIATQTELAITQDTDAHLRNGEASWIYYEEVFNRNWRAFWWSPDSRHVAFCRYDETGMPIFHAVDTLPLHGELDEHGSPQAGRPEPGRRFGRGACVGLTR